MAIIKCKECGNKISNKATTCPNCGHPNKTSSNSRLPILLVIMVILSVLVWLSESGVFRVFPNIVKTETVADSLSDIYGQVVSDQIKQYEIAKRQGDPVQICVQAGLVCAAYLQAKEEYKYQNWKKIEAEDCKRVGLHK